MTELDKAYFAENIGIEEEDIVEILDHRNFDDVILIISKFTGRKKKRRFLYFSLFEHFSYIYSAVITFPELSKVLTENEQFYYELQKFRNRLIASKLCNKTLSLSKANELMISYAFRYLKSLEGKRVVK